MIRWRYFLVVALLLLLPAKTGCEDDDEEEHGDDAEGGDDDDEDDDDDDDDAADKKEVPSAVALRAPTPSQPVPIAVRPVTTTTKRIEVTVAKVEKKRPLECYVCAYKAETPMRSCLDPTKFRVHTLTCHSADDKCFTSIISKHGSYEAVVRGCRSNCIGTPDTTCCELNRCNNQALAMPSPAAHALKAAGNGADKPLPPNVLFFVTILLVLQTVVRVIV